MLNSNIISTIVFRFWSSTLWHTSILMNKNWNDSVIPKIIHIFYQNLVFRDIIEHNHQQMKEQRCQDFTILDLVISYFKRPQVFVAVNLPLSTLVKPYNFRSAALFEIWQTRIFKKKNRPYSETPKFMVREFVANV